MTRPPFAYYGGKTTLAQRIAALLPPHTHYVEPFAGGLSVLLAKPRSRYETVNDLDHRLMLFWRMLRDRPAELARVCELTPHSRAEMALARDLDCEDELEVARRVWVVLSQSYGGTTDPVGGGGWRLNRQAGRPTAGKVISHAANILPCAARLRGVSLECRPALDVIRDYGGYDGVLLYCDPPYLSSVRSSPSSNYTIELGAEAEHRELAEALRGCDAAVVLSGYRSALYDELYGDWWQVGFKARKRSCAAVVEMLWSNRPLTADLFSEEAL